MKLAIIAACLALAGCGQYELASGGTIPAGKSRDQVKLDVLTCKEEARVETQTAGDQARGFALGATLSLVGVAIEYDIQKRDRRRVFKSCMEREGYSIQPGTD